MFASLIAVACGGAVGSVLRWWMSLRLNGLNQHIPLGTLAVNILGSFIIGILIASFTRMPNLDPMWRALLVTGFCGGLTTFSTFSAEVVGMLYSDRFGWALVIAASHLICALAMTYLAFLLVQWLAPR
ncbi:fluoride efflux transporter CrcB [Carnimonas nigrificans]|uniref:fluoride efflux transporter CrcB n=1 Tax=Carnimonas nigrificans TaxID=64323 RepID=UPI00046F31C3|nr:fluoride efflux transporter CrcB [Carnimonas nigrificans]